jgi:glutathione S-transferase
MKMNAWTSHFIGGGLTALEAHVKETGGVYCVGDTVTLADAYMVPQLWSAERFIDPSVLKRSYPTLSAICDRLQKLPAFVAAAPAAQRDFPQQPWVQALIDW